MRIADVLRERDDGDDNTSGDNPLTTFASKSHHASPNAVAGSSCRFLLSRWFRNRRKHAPAASGGERVVQSSAADGIVTGRVDSSGRLPEIDLSSGVRPNEIAFNLGMGIGMAFVLAGNANEMNKMAELRKQMEMLLKDIKGEVQSRDDSSLCALSDAGEDAFSTTISIQTEESNRKNHQSFRAMDQLEAELQVELRRMELNFEGEAGKHKMELKSEKDDSSSGGGGSAWYDRMPDENGEEERHDVCAHDLERRLHELLQTRQQERIEALESALVAAQRRLDEKEDELCHWRGNGGLINPENEETYFSLSFK